MCDIFSLLYRFLRKIFSFLQFHYVKRWVKGSNVPIILGNVYIQTKNLKIGKNVTLYPGVYLWGNNIEIGDNVNIGVGTIIFSKKRVKIGDNTLIAGQCYIIDSNHGVALDKLIREQELESSEYGIEIGEDVWIGAQCAILKGAKINKGAVIGAQSLVNTEIPSNAIAVGSPAKILKYRK